MSQLQPIKLADGTTIYIEANEEISTPVTRHAEAENTRGSRSATVQTTQQVIQNIASLQDTIKSFAVNTLDSFREIANANVDKVTLEFGINVGGEAGIPYITKGSVGSNIKITVECSFKNQQS
jgi:hypothetical protein